MAAGKNKNFTVDDMKAKYDDVTRLYDYAEELVSTVESEFVKDPAGQLDLVEPLINEISEATDVLSEELIFIAEGKKYKASGKSNKTRVEGAFRRIFAAINDYEERVTAMGKKAHGALRNIADPIVKKIQRHVEEIVVVFLEFIQFSLHSVMGKMELEALRVRDTRIAMLMHQQAMQQQQ